MKDTHLNDDALVALCLDEASSESSDHLVACPACARRLAATAALLEDIGDAAAATADAAFPAERCARQQARILQRIEQHARVGRVLNFPHAHPPAPSQRPTRMRRWIAGAAAAGLFIGMLAGRLVHELPVLQRQAPAPAAAAARQPAASLRAASTSVSDDEFMREVQRAIDRKGPVALGRLDALTPVAWEMIEIEQ